MSDDVKTPPNFDDEQMFHEWMAQPPSRAEMYKVVAKILNMSAQLADSMADLISDDRRGSIKSLQVALTQMSALGDSIPVGPDPQKQPVDGQGGANGKD